MTAFDDTLIAGALQSDYVDANDRGVYAVPDINGGTYSKYNAYFWLGIYFWFRFWLS